MDWSDRAACLTAEPETFFPIGNSGAALDDVVAAKAVCRGCPVLDPCRSYALRTRQPKVFEGRFATMLFSYDMIDLVKKEAPRLGNPAILAKPCAALADR